jgi:acetyl esterase/lipase
MATSPQFQKLVQMLLSRRRPPGPLDVDNMRMGFTAAALPAPADVERGAVTIGGVEVEQLTPPDAASDRVVLYLHGGGFVIGSPQTHRKLAADIGRAAGARVLLPDYPLAPERPFPAALDWLVGLYEGLVARIDPRRLAVAGDSAGGNLTAALLVALRERGTPLPAAAVLVSPWLDLVRADVEGDRRRAEADPIMQPYELVQFRDWYVGDGDPRDARVSPVVADLHGLPPLLVQVGSAEMIVEDSRVFAERARAAGVRVELEVADEMIHVWHIFAGRVPEATKAVERIGRFLRAHLS